MNMSIMIKDLPKEDLPRERLLTYGASSLSNEELIAIILRTGTVDMSVKDLATTLLSMCGDITNLKYMSIKKLSEVKGLGNVKAVTLLAALELGKRVYEENKITAKLRIHNAVDAFRYFSKFIMGDKQENLLVIYLDNQKQYINYKILFKGTLNQSVVHPREVFKEAYMESSNAIIVMHNHPSGDITPSKADDEFTYKLANIGNLMGVELLDHIIVGGGTYFSYIEEGRLRYE